MAFSAHAATNVSFQWDANTEADLAGYKVYRSDVSSSNYTEVGDIAAPTVTFTEENVPDGTWFWVATAYDTYGNESEYSNEVTAILDTVTCTASEFNHLAEDYCLAEVVVWNERI